MFRELEDLFLEKTPLQLNESSNDTLYHYTTVDALYNILKCPNLQITQADFLNDYSEIRYFKDVVTKACGEVFENEKNAFWDLLEKHTTIMVNLFSKYYIFSLTYNENNLSLWRNYSKNDGYNFGIFLQPFLYQAKSIEPELYIVHAEVIYDRDEQTRIIADEIRKVLNIQKEHNTPNADCVAALIRERFNRYQLFFKDPAFVHEEEYRIVFCNTNEQKLKYKPRNGHIVPYIEVPLSDKKGNQTIAKIKIGPMNRSELAKKGLELFLEQGGYNQPFKIPIDYSRIPVRF